MLEAATAFQRHFGTVPTQMVRAPGRLEVLGNHTDYNEGLVMALAVDKYVALAGAPRDDDQVEVVSTAFPGAVRFALAGIAKDASAPWADYLKGVLLELRGRDVPLRGFNVAIHSTIPLGAGLSSSAALLVSTALLVRKFAPYALAPDGAGTALPRWSDGELPGLGSAEKLALAKLCQAAENRFVGVNCGLLDHLSSLFGRADQVILIDCRDLTVDHTPLHPDLAAVVCHSGVRHALVGGEYNDRRRSCEAAARALGVPSLRHVSLEGLAAGRAKLSPHEHECALHVVGENDRVTRGAARLRAGEFDAFGQLLFQSHESSRLNFHNSCAALDVLVELAKGQPGCLGARLTGGGFGGATLNLVRREAVEAFRGAMAAAYEAQTGQRLESWVCRAVDGAA
jgi:galactokinase